MMSVKRKRGVMCKSNPIPDEDLQKLITESQEEEGGRGQGGGRGLHNDKAVMDAIKKNKSAAEAKYVFPKYDSDDSESDADSDCDYYPPKHRYSPLYIAIRENASFDVVNTLYRAYPKAARETIRDGSTLLHYAVTYHKSPKVLTLLLEEWPAAMGVKGTCRMTPLHVACENNAGAEVVPLLLKHWPNAAQIKNNIIQTPLHVAIENNASIEVISLLLKQWPDALEVQAFCGGTPLYTACKCNASIEVISLLLEQWPDAVGVEDAIGQTPLHIACRHNASSEVISLLLEHWPAAAKVKNDEGDTPHVHSGKQKTMLSGIRSLLNKTEQPTATQIINDFVAIEWWGGVWRVFDLHSGSVKSLESVPLNVIPSMLSVLGRRCRLLTLWNIIRNKQDILKIS